MSDLGGVNQNVVSNSTQLNAATMQIKKEFTVGNLFGYEIDMAELVDSALEDAQEEVTFGKDNSKQTKLERRQQRNSELRFEESMKKLREAMKSKVTSNEKSSDLKNMAQRSDTKPDDLIKRLLSYDQRHSAEDYALLLNLADEATSPREAELFKSAAELMYADNKGTINAVINAIDVNADNFAGYTPLENAENYADALINFKDSFQMLDFIEKKYGSNIEEGLDFMNKALGADLDSAQKSHEAEFLQSVAMGLGQTKQLYSAYNHEKNLLDRLATNLEVDVSGVDKVDFLKKVGLLSSSSFVSPSEVRNLLSEVQTKNPEQEVILCQELSKTLHSLSDVIYGSNEARGRINDALERLIDDKIALEDEWLLAKQ